MNVFVAGAAGALSKQPVPTLVATEPKPPAKAEDGVAALRHLEDGVTP